MPESLVSASPNSNGGLLSLMRRRFSEGFVAPPVNESGVADETDLIAAAVLVPVVMRESGATMLLTQRTMHLRDHAGQVSFPGGRSEARDASAEATALREVEEEVGIPACQIEILGRLPEYRTGTGFVITPIVGLVTPPLNLKLDDFEVADVFEPPLEFLLDRANHERHTIEVGGIMHEYWAMPWQGYYIWGATAGMLVTLHHFLFRENVTT